MKLVMNNGQIEIVIVIVKGKANHSIIKYSYNVYAKGRMKFLILPWLLQLEKGGNRIRYLFGANGGGVML